MDIIPVCGQEESRAVGGCYPSMEMWDFLCSAGYVLIQEQGGKVNQMLII